ncbi:hypothetical protein BOX15_Mlig027378g1, partial [Macrostomum lignano]
QAILPLETNNSRNSKSTASAMSRLMLDDSPPPLSAADSDDSSAELLARRLALSDSLAASYPAAALSNALRDAPGASALDDVDDDAVGAADPLSRSCFASLRASPSVGGGGSELGDLDWLVNYRPPDLLNPGLGESDATGQPPAAEAAGAASVKKEPFPQSTFASCGNRFHSGYDPHKDRLLKPPYSFSCLIFMALEAAPNKCLPVRRIYQWIEQKFPFYRQAQNGWKNSVRHNLSLNKSFTKVQRDTSAKGSLWTIDPMARAGMLQALKKTPYHPYAQVQMFSATGTMYKTGGGGMRRETKSPLPLQQQQQQGSSYSSVLGTNALLAHSSAMVKMDDNVSSNCDDELASVSDIQQQQQQQRMQYHPNVNSFKGHVTPVKGPPTLKQPSPSESQPLQQQQQQQQQPAIKSETFDEADEDKSKQRQRCRKQDLLPSAHLYPFLAAKMKRLVHILGDQAADGQQLAGSDATSLRELRRQRGDIVDVDVDEDEDDDEDEDGYVEIEQPIKRPRGRPRKDCAQMYRLLPPARLLKKKKRKRRSSGMPSVNQLVAAAQMAQMKRAATAATAATATATATEAKPAVSNATISSAATVSNDTSDNAKAANDKPASDAAAQSSSSSKAKLPDARALYLKYRCQSSDDASAAATTTTDAAAGEATVQPRRLPPILSVGGLAETRDKIPIEEASVLASLALNGATRESQPSSEPIGTANSAKQPPVVASPIVVKSSAASSLIGSRVHIVTSSASRSASAAGSGRFSIANGGSGIVVKLAGKPLN